MSKLMQLIRPDLQQFHPYSSARDEAKPNGILLNANESPYPVEFQNDVLINRYPEKQPTKLIALLATIYGVAAKQIVLSRGSDEVIDLLTRLFCRAGEDAIMICPPTFGMYSVCGRLQGAKVIEVPLLKEKNYQLDLPAILSTWNSKLKIIFLCSPNNPTGNLLNKEDVLYLCEQLRNRCIVVVDEAYIEFSDTTSFSNYINQNDNLVVLRTLSKAYGLAGARCGVLLAQEDLVQWIMKIIPPYPMPSLTSQFVFQTLSANMAQIQQQIACIKSERIRLFNSLKTLPIIQKIWPSEANFILFATAYPQNVMEFCAQNGIVIRSMQGKLSLDDCVRVSLGLSEENDHLISVLQQMSAL